MTDFHIKTSGDVWHLEGEATVFSLSHHQGLIKMSKPSSGRWCLDCTKLVQIDTSGLAYFLECVRHARDNDLDFSIKHIPENALALASVQGVEAIIANYID